MSYYTISHIGEPVRVPVGSMPSCGEHGHTLGSADCVIGDTSAMWHGYSVTRVAGYLLLPLNEAKTMMRLLTRAPGGNLHNLPVSKRTPEEQRLVLKYWHDKKPKTNIGGQNRLEEIERGMLHLSKNPCGVDLSGGFLKKVTKIALKALPDIATGGLYSVAKAGINVAKGKQSILGGLKSAIVRQGPAGALLTAAVGENKSLAIQGAVAGGALTAAGLSTAAGATGLATKVLSTPRPAPALPPQPVDPYAYSSEQLMPPFYQGAPGYTVPAGGPGVAEAGMFGGLSPMMIGLLIGVPLLFTLINRPAERR